MHGHGRSLASPRRRGHVSTLHSARSLPAERSWADRNVTMKCCHFGVAQP
jgi:hypothetical protein